NLIFCFRKCSARRTPCFPKRPAWKAKLWRSRGSRWRSKRKSRNCGNRCRTSNERDKRGCTAGGDRVRAVGLGEIDAGAEGIGAAGDDAFDILHHQAPAGDRGHWKML